MHLTSIRSEHAHACAAWVGSARARCGDDMVGRMDGHGRRGSGLHGLHIMWMAWAVHVAGWHPHTGLLPFF